MTNKSTECYQQIFQYIADNFENLKPKQSMSDHELAIRKALKLVFPEIQVRTCYFHYVQVSYIDFINYLNYRLCNKYNRII